MGSTWAQRVEHVGAQLCCSFPARAGPERGSEGARALVGLGPTATVPQHQAVMAECWWSLEGMGDTWVRLSAGTSLWGM